MRKTKSRKINIQANLDRLVTKICSQDMQVMDIENHKYTSLKLTIKAVFSATTLGWLLKLKGLLSWWLKLPQTKMRRLNSSSSMLLLKKRKPWRVITNVSLSTTRSGGGLSNIYTHDNSSWLRYCLGGSLMIKKCKSFFAFNPNKILISKSRLNTRPLKNKFTELSSGSVINITQGLIYS